MPSLLKSLELHGYKTFAAPTQFDFAGTITAIVGPNGSGKSNIADSIRWVLGEQSYSLLRGKKTEDMIFSGSELKPRAGMASATIVFDNSDGWLPIDFSEVAITRRAYRDGENEYLLNGQRVRLRDVSELLAQSGLAERTYTIIGQGLVDAALALKAEERRRLFEEAAGIGLHRARREESIRRLETTLRNIERVQDILTELQPRLRSLERQARRAQEYEQVKADLRVILREWYGYHWHRSQSELSEAREQARRQEISLEKARQDHNVLDGKLSSSREGIQNIRVQLGAWHRQSALLHNQREALSRDLAVADERLRSLSEQQHSAVEESARLEEELSFQRERLADAAEEMNRIKGELEEARQQAESAQKAYHDRQSERIEVETKVQETRQTLTAATARQSHLQARLAERQSQAERQAEMLQAAILGFGKAESEALTVEGSLKSCIKALEESRNARQAAEEALQIQQNKVSELEALRKDTLEEQANSSADLSRLRAQLEVLEQAENALTGYATGTQLLLEAARQDRLNGARGALSSQLDIPAELETAIAAALGEFVDAILLNESGSEQALELLEGQNSRAVLLPLELLAPITRDKLEFPGVSQDDLLGCAAELIKAPLELQPVIRLLLGNVWVVSNRQAARKMLSVYDKSMKAGDNLNGLKLVTLRGEVFFASGPILAGQEGKPGTLSRPRQRRELQKDLEEAEQKIAEIDRRLEQVDQDLSQARSQASKLAGDVQQKRKLEDQSRTSHRQQDLELEKARRQLQWQRDQRSRLEADISRQAGEASQISSGLKAIEREITETREKLRSQSAVLAELSTEELQTQLSHWQTRAAVAERAQSEAFSRQQERQSNLEKSLHLQANLQARIDEAQENAQKLETGKASLHEQESEISKQIDALRLQIDPAETELEKAEKVQAGLEKSEAEARQLLSLAEHYHAQAKISLAKRQEALDSLRQRIEDDFGLVSFEYSQDISGPTPLPIDGMVEQLPLVKELSQEIDEAIKRQRGQLRRMGAVNPEAQAEYLQVKERYEFLTSQVEDLKKAESDVREVIAELDLLMEREFRKTFDAVAQEFRGIFARLFGGGSARLMLTDPEDLTNTGIDIEARLPGRRSQGLSLLSGGERSLTATSLVFALLKVSPTPFCLLDEVDAMLDEANVGRFRDLLRELSQNTQFIIVTHNRNTVQAADVIYGVTMGPDSASQVLSLKLDEVDRVVDKNDL